MFTLESVFISACNNLYTSYCSLRNNYSPGSVLLQVRGKQVQRSIPFRPFFQKTATFCVFLSKRYTRISEIHGYAGNFCIPFQHFFGKTATFCAFLSKRYTLCFLRSQRLRDIYIKKQKKTAVKRSFFNVFFVSMQVTEISSQVTVVSMQVTAVSTQVTTASSQGTVLYTTFRILQLLQAYPVPRSRRRGLRRPARGR